MVSLDIKMNQSILRRWEEYLENGMENLENLMNETGEHALYLARMNAPVGVGYAHAGDMRDEIKLTPTKNGFTLSCPVTDGEGQPYALFNEYGSPNTPAGTIKDPIKSRSGGFRPFMRPAIIKARDKASFLFGKKWYRKGFSIGEE